MKKPPGVLPKSSNFGRPRETIDQVPGRRGAHAEMRALLLPLRALLLLLLASGLQAYALLPFVLRRRPNGPRYPQRAVTGMHMPSDGTLLRDFAPRYGSGDARRWSGPPRGSPSGRGAKRRGRGRGEPQRLPLTADGNPHPRLLTNMVKSCTTCRELLELQARARELPPRIPPQRLTATAAMHVGSMPPSLVLCFFSPCTHLSWPCVWSVWRRRSTGTAST